MISGTTLVDVCDDDGGDDVDVESHRVYFCLSEFIGSFQASLH